MPPGAEEMPGRDCAIRFPAACQRSGTKLVIFALHEVFAPTAHGSHMTMTLCGLLPVEQTGNAVYLEK